MSALESAVQMLRTMKDEAHAAMIKGDVGGLASQLAGVHDVGVLDEGVKGLIAAGVLRPVLYRNDDLMALGYLMVMPDGEPLGVMVPANDGSGAGMADYDEYWSAVDTAFWLEHVA